MRPKKLAGDTRLGNQRRVFGYNYTYSTVLCTSIIIIFYLLSLLTKSVTFRHALTRPK